MEQNLDKTVKTSKRLLSFLADFFLLFVIASGLYSILVYPLMKQLPSYKEVVTEQEENLNTCRQMYVDGHLMEYDTTPTDFANKCIKNKMNDHNNDTFIYFYTIYLNGLHKAGLNYSYNIEYVNTNIYNYSSQGETVLFELDESISKPLKLTSIALEMLNKYFNGDVTKENETYYNKIMDLYKSNLVLAERLLVGTDEYVSHYKIITETNKTLYLYITISSLITYTVFFIPIYIVLPLVFKNGQTVGKKILKIGLYHDTRNPIRNRVLIVRALLEYLMYFFMVLFIPVWQIGTSVVNLPLFIFPTFTINLFAIAFISIFLSFVSFAFMVVNEDKQALHDKVSKVYPYRMDVQLEEENAIKNEEFHQKELEEEDGSDIRES